MKFETEYKNIIFKFTLEKENFPDVSFFMSDKFNRLSNQTIVEVKKGNLWPYNILIESVANDESFTHYLSTILLSTQSDDELMDDLSYYLEQENTLDEIADLRELYALTPGPKWKVNL